MNDELLQQRLEQLFERLRTAYDGIGHSSGRPYIYFVYEPILELKLQRLIIDQLRSDNHLNFHHIDLLSISLKSLDGQEVRRQQLLNDPLRAEGTSEAIVRLWARTLSREIAARLEAPGPSVMGKPVVVLQGLAALHPLGHPTGLMEGLAEEEPRDPQTNAIIPIVLFVPGIRPAQTSRRYLFLGLDELRLDFYRGEEI